MHVCHKPYIHVHAVSMLNVHVYRSVYVCACILKMTFHKYMYKCTYIHKSSYMYILAYMHIQAHTVLCLHIHAHTDIRNEFVCASIHSCTYCSSKGSILLLGRHIHAETDRYMQTVIFQYHILNASMY